MVSSDRQFLLCQTLAYLVSIADFLPESGSTLQFEHSDFNFKTPTTLKLVSQDKKPATKRRHDDQDREQEPFALQFVHHLS